MTTTPDHSPPPPPNLFSTLTIDAHVCDGAEFKNKLMGVMVYF
jgi:hypothetical protein